MDAKTLPTTGNYTIVVDTFRTAAGTVTLTLFDLPPDVSATATLGGPAVTLTTVAAGQNARALFTGTAGDGVIVRTGPANCCSTSVSVLKPDGTTLVGPSYFTIAGGFIYTKLTVSGTYTVVVNYQGTSLGSTSVSVGLDNTPPSAPTLTLSTSTPDAFVQGATVFYRPADGNVHGHRQRHRWRLGGFTSDLPRFERRSHADHGRHGRRHRRTSRTIRGPPAPRSRASHEHGDRIRQGREHVNSDVHGQAGLCSPHDDRQHRVESEMPGRTRTRPSP